MLKNIINNSIKKIREINIADIAENTVKKVRGIYKEKIDPIKEEVRPYINEEDFTKIESIIHSCSVSAAASSAAMAQGAAFGLDTPVLITIHIGMIITLGEVFGRKLNKTTATALLGAAAGVGIGVFGVKAILGFIPIGGNVVNAAVSFSYTELLGWTFVKHFKEDKDTGQLIDIQGGEGLMGDQYINTGMTGAMGRKAHAENNTFQQIQSLLVTELSKLKDRMRSQANSAEEHTAAEDVAYAEQAAQNWEESKMIDHLKKAGKWALRQAEEIGTNVAAEIIKKSIGM